MLYSGLRSVPQSFNVIAGTAQTIIGANGTVFNFYPNSFKDENGHTITTGTVNIQITEMTKPGEMIANHTNTMAYGLLLQSGGEVNITASMNGKNVSPNRYGIGFPQTNPSIKPMELFYGMPGEMQTASLVGSTVINWNIADTSKKGSTVNGTNNDSVSYYSPKYSFYYLFDSCTNFNWINCDHFYGDPTTSMNINIVVPDNSFDNTNTQIYIVYPSINSTQKFSGTYNKLTHAFNNPGIKIPNGMTIEIVVLAYKKDSYYYYDKTGIPTNGMSVNADLITDTKDDIIT